MKICFLGDSLTQGYPFSKEFSWVSIISEQLNLKMINHGVCGETTADFVARMNWVLVDPAITHLVIFGGLNDIIERRLPKHIITDLKRCGNIATAKKIVVAYVLPFLPSDEFYLKSIIKLRYILQHAFHNKHHFIIDLQPKNSPQSVIPSLDGVHPTIEGHQLLAKIALSQFKLWLRI